MDPRAAALWCKHLGRLVEVTLIPALPGTTASAGVPCGWVVSECCERAEACYGSDCQFTSDTPTSPFGQVGDLP